MTDYIKSKSHEFIRSHPNVIVSLIKGDTVAIADPSDASKKIKDPKRLRQISIRELHNDLIKHVPGECTSSCGKILVNDTNLTANMPPDVKRMSNRYKEMCGCITRLMMEMFQESLNRVSRNILEQMKRSHDRSKCGGSKRKAIANKIKRYETEMNFKKTVREAVTKVHCKMLMNLDGPYFDGLYHISCAYTWCPNCPQYQLHPIEKQLVRKDELLFVTFHTYENIYPCSEHGPLPDNKRVCLYCGKKEDGEKDWNINVRNKIVSK